MTTEDRAAGTRARFGGAKESVEREATLFRKFRRCFGGSPCVLLAAPHHQWQWQ